LIERGDRFEWKADELAHWAVEILQQPLTLSRKEEQSRQEEGKHS
jgi:hypothetical protein